MGMMMQLNPDQLDVNQYTVSLMQEAFRVGLIPVGKVETLQGGIMESLKGLILMQTRENSVSIRVEQAERLLASLLYSVDLYLMDLGSPEAAAAAIAAMTAEDLQKAADKHLRQVVKRTRVRYTQIESQRMSLPNVVYSETFQLAIPKFLKGYDPIFAAQDAGSDMDYPLAFDDLSVQGIRYLRQYLQAFEVESRFVNCFDREDVLALITWNGRKHRINYELAPVNFYELVFGNALFAMLAGKPLWKTRLTPGESEALIIRLNSLDTNAVQGLLSINAAKLVEASRQETPEALAYLAQTAEALTARILQSWEHGNLDELILYEPVPETVCDEILVPGNKLPDDVFRFVYQTLLSQSQVEDKLRVMNRYVSTLDDFEDLLAAGCFEADEYPAVFGQLGDLELGTLLGKLLQREQLNGPKQLMALLQQVSLDGPDWIMMLCRWMEQLAPERTLELGERVCRLQQTEIV